MEIDACQIKYDQIVENMIQIENDEIIFDIGAIELFKKGSSTTNLKIKNLMQIKIALRITVPKERFAVSPIFSYLDSLESITYKFSYIYKEKSIDNKNYAIIEVIDIPKLKKGNNINPATLFDFVSKNNILVKGYEKRILIKLVNSQELSNKHFPNNLTNLMPTDKQIILAIPQIKKDNDDDEKDKDDAKILCNLIKEIGLVNMNKLYKDETEKKIFNIFKKSNVFDKFLRFFKIDDFSLKHAIKNFEYLHVPKHYYIFYQGDHSKQFFGIINGKVSLRVKKKINFAKENNTDPKIANRTTRKNVEPIAGTQFKTIKNMTSPLNSYDPRSDINGSEIEVMQLRDGTCFGEWGLIYNMVRSSSALTVEDTDFFMLSKDNFLGSFGKNIYKSEYERKNFLINSLPFLRDVHRTKIDEIYRKITIEFPLRGQIIYSENSKAEFIYLIIQGECRVEKILINSESEDLTKKKKIILLKLGIGDFSGLEIVSGEEIYKYSLISSSDYTSLMKFNINIWFDFNDQITKFLTPLYDKKEKFLKESLNVCLEKKLMIKYNNKNHFKLIRKETKREESEKLEKIQNFIEKIERKNHNISFIKPNFKTNTKVENRFNLTEININPNNNYLNSKTISNNKKLEIIPKKPLSSSQNKEHIPNSMRKSFFSPLSKQIEKNKEMIKQSNESYDYEDSFNYANTNTKRFAIPLNKKKNSLKIDITEITHIDANLEDDEKKNNYSLNIGKSSSKKIINCQKLLIVSNNVKNNLIEWKNVKISHKFHSGNFNLPLYTFTK